MPNGPLQGVPSWREARPWVWAAEGLRGIELRLGNSDGVGIRICSGVDEGLQA